MLKPGAGPITIESRVDETITRQSLAIERLADRSTRPQGPSSPSEPRVARGEKETSPAGGARTTPPVGAIGSTGSYHEPSGDAVEVSVVSVLEARGPD
jgi:hypothetical protein